MTYKHLVINDRPDGAWSLDSYPFLDHAGNSRKATGSRRVNYSANPNLDTNGGVFGLATAPATRVFEEGVSLFGSNSLKVTATGAGALGVAIGTTVTPAPIARTFTVGWWVYPLVAKGLSTYAEWSGGAAGGTNPINAPSAAEKWHFMRGTFTLPANATAFRAGPIMNSVVTGDSYYVSGHIVVEGAMLDPATLDLNSISGYISKTLPGSTSLVASTGTSAITSPLNQLQVDSEVMATGSESKPFTLEAWFRADSVDTITTILGNEGTDSGLTFDGDAIRFITNYTASGSSEVEYYPTDTSKVMHLVGVHTAGFNRLYVDGVMVGESLLTEEQRQDTYAPVTNENVLVSGYSTDADSRITIDFPAIYAYDLRTDKIVNHFKAGRRTDDFYGVVENYGGTYWTLDDTTASIVRRDAFTSFRDWNRGMFDNANGSSGTLIPETDVDGSFLPGSWKWGYILSGAFIAASKVEWDSDGDVLVEGSVDNEETWQPIENGQGFADLNNTTESVSVRVSLTGDARVRSLTLVTYSDLTMTSNDSTRFLQWFGAASPGSTLFVPIEQSSRGRLETYEAAGLITASNLPDGLENIGAVELWVNVKPGTDTKYLVDMRVSDTGPRAWIEGQTLKVDSGQVYVNGVSTANDSTFTRGQWQHVVFIPDTLSSNAVWVLGNEQDLNRMSALLGHVAVYPTQLSYSQVADIYGAYTSFESIRLIDDNTVTITEPTGKIKIYSFNWSVRTAA